MVSSEIAEPSDQIAELLRIVGEDQSAQPAKFSGAKKAQPTSPRDHGRRQLVRKAMRKAKPGDGKAMRVQPDRGDVADWRNAGINNKSLWRK